MATQATMTDHAGRYHAQQHKGVACVPPLQATCALLQVLFLTVNMLTGHHRQAFQAIQEQKHTEQVRGGHCKAPIVNWCVTQPCAKVHTIAWLAMIGGGIEQTHTLIGSGDKQIYTTVLAEGGAYTTHNHMCCVLQMLCLRLCLYCKSSLSGQQCWFSCKEGAGAQIPLLRQQPCDK